MMSLTAKAIAHATGGKLPNGLSSRRCMRISTDTRSVKRGDWFLALRGENFDGHRFIEQALEAGASGLITEEMHEGGKRHPVVLVEDTLKAYGDITGAWLRRLRTPVVAITGSSGKTTTKDMLGAMSKRLGATLVTEGNLNNRIGVPHMLQRLTPRHRWAVMEIGMNMPGEIDALGQILRPRIGVITNVGITHSGMFKDGARGVLNAKAEILDHITRVVVLNADCPNTPALRRRAKRRGLKVVTFGVGKWSRADYRAKIIEGLSPFGHRVDLRTPSASVTVDLRLFGHHNVANLIAATAAADLMHIEAETIPRAMKGFTPTGMRSQVREIGDVTVIADCYNSSPDSVREALRALGESKCDSKCESKCEGKRIAVLGDMLELGRRAKAEHRRVGREINRNGIDRLLTFGEEARLMGEIAKCKTQHFSDPAACARHLAKHTQAGDIVLVKGSRGIAMERIIEAWEGLS